MTGRGAAPAFLSTREAGLYQSAFRTSERYT